MGKSNKKIKNDRINTLRKQYDAFLEEDKKRRERNEYILGKLDKMRLSTALVPISNKTNVNYQLEVNPPEAYARPDNLRPKSIVFDNSMRHLGGHNISPNVLNGHMVESKMLREISKNYILIPKRTFPLENEYTYSKDVIDDTDWKSKYSILDDLKEQEKEGRPDSVLNQNNSTVRSSKKDSELTTIGNHNINTDSSQKPVSNKNSDLTDVNQLDTCLGEQSKKGNENITTTIPEIISEVGEENNIPLQTEFVSTNESSQIITEPIYSTDIGNTHEIIHPQMERDIAEREYYSDSNKNNTNQVTQNFNNDRYTNEENVGNQMYYQEDANQSDYNQLISESKNVSNTSFINSEQISYGEQLQESKPVELLNENLNIHEYPENKHDVHVRQDLKSVDRVETYDNVGNISEEQRELDQFPHEISQHYEPTEESISAVLDNIEHIEPVNHDSEINAFETEQKDMFYAEQTGGENYRYSEEGTVGEYPAGDYGHNEQYGYYEGAQEEQAYATNINEHEESTERYDPHYNEQYQTSGENQQPDNTINYADPSVQVHLYDQQQYQEGNYENAQFENVVDYENQDSTKIYQQENVGHEDNVQVQENVLHTQENEMYNEQLYVEQPNAQNIEQQVIMEEGYIEDGQVNVVDIKKDNKDESEDVINASTVEQTPDPKLT